MNPSPNSEERIWAVLSHLSALAFGMGLVLPIIGWSEQRNKSRYATFQCLQAFGYQSLGYTIWLLSYLVVAILFLVLVIVESFRVGTYGSPNRTFSGMGAGLFLLFFFGLFAIYMLLPVIAAIACGFGKNFHYPIMGTRLARYLGYDLSQGTDSPVDLNTEHQERWVAAMGHFSVIILFWGLLAPLTTWILQRKQNRFLRFQSVQTAIYQLIVNVIYLGATILSLAATMTVMLWTVLDGDFNNSSALLPVGLSLLFVLMLVTFLVMLVVPLFHILGQWAGYRVLKGDDYRYPIIGKMIEKRLPKSYRVQELAPGSNGKPFESIKENP